MVQVLKNEIRERIYQAALLVFFEKDFRGARMKDIAEKAGIPTGLMYSYYKNKAALFDEIVSGVYHSLEQIVEKEEEESVGLPYERFHSIESEFLSYLTSNHQKIVIVMDKSQGTRHEKTKEKLIARLEKHIQKGMEQRSGRSYDRVFIHILANNFTENLLEVLRHYQGREWAEQMFKLVFQCSYRGVNSLYEGE